MAKCEVCQKDMFFGRKLSITRSQIARRAKNRQRANIKRVRVCWQPPKRMNVCTNCLKSGRVERA